RQLGKLHLASEALEPNSLNSALFITDSLDDLPLLDKCGYPMRVIWPNARYVPALSGVYLPGEYLSKVKRPNGRYIIRGVIQEDFAFWVLSTIALATQPVTHVLGLLILLISFWAVYERGYVDNDLIAARYEDDPKLSEAFWNSNVCTSLWQAWAWALGTGALGVFVLRWQQPVVWQDYAQWLGVLLATYGWFWLFNRLDKATRVWMYGWLQLARAGAFLVLTPGVTSGVLALSSHALARWVSYRTYRFTARDSWPPTFPETTRLLFFVVLTIMLAAAE